MKGGGQRKEDKPEVWPEHWTAWRVFMAMATQWTCAGMAAVRIGLRYESLPAVAQMLEVEWPLPARVFADIRLMEAEALSAWSRRHSGA